MPGKYIVIDADGGVSFNADKEAPESFASAPAAEKRAKELARSSPGEAIGIYVLESEAVAPVGNVEIKSTK